MLSFSIGTFLTNYDVTIRKQQRERKLTIVLHWMKRTKIRKKKSNGDYYIDWTEGRQMKGLKALWV